MMKFLLLLTILCLSYNTCLSANCIDYPGTSKEVFKYKTYGDVWEAEFRNVGGSTLSIPPEDVLRGSKKRKIQIKNKTSYTVSLVPNRPPCAVVEICLKVRYVNSIVFSVFDENDNLLEQNWYASFLYKLKWTKHCIMFVYEGVAKISMTFRIVSGKKLMHLRGLSITTCC